MNPVEKIIGKKGIVKDKYGKNDTYSKEYIDYEKVQEALERKERQVWKDYARQKAGKYTSKGG